jgi:hypothetical protein
MIQRGSALTSLLVDVRLAVLLFLLFLLLLVRIPLHVLAAAPAPLRARRLLEQDTARADLALGREPDALLARFDLDALAQRGEVTADPLELGRRHGDGRVVLRVGDTEMLLVDVHELHLVLSNPVLLYTVVSKR